MKQNKNRFVDRLLPAMSRFVVFLLWGLLVAVFVFVAYLVAFVKPH